MGSAGITNDGRRGSLSHLVMFIYVLTPSLSTTQFCYYPTSMMKRQKEYHIYNVYFSSDSVLCTSYAGGCHVGDYPMMTATTESVFLNLLVKNEPEDLTGHRERQGDPFFSSSL